MLRSSRRKHSRRLRHSYLVCAFVTFVIAQRADISLAAAVGTVQVRSLIEPLRKIVARLHGHYISGKAVDLVMSDRLIEVETRGADGSKREVYIP